MLLTSNEAELRLNSIDNLFNRLNRNDKVIDVTPESNELESHETASNASRIRHSSESIENLPPHAEDLIADLEQKLKTARITELAEDNLELSLLSLKDRLIEVESPRDLAKIATDMGKVIQITNPPKKQDDQIRNQVIIFKPVMVTESHYEQLVVNE